jgi:hypothetical protein
MSTYREGYLGTSLNMLFCIVQMDGLTASNFIILSGITQHVCWMYCWEGVKVTMINVVAKQTLKAEDKRDKPKNG